MRKFSRNLAFGLSFLALLLAVLTIPHSHGKRELSALRSILQARGEKLTLLVLSPPPATNREDVLAREILSTNGLTLPGIIPAQPQYDSPGRARVAWGPGSKIDLLVMGTAPSTNEEWSLLESALSRQMDLVLGLQTALKTPPGDAGFPQRDPRQLPKLDFALVRQFSQVLGTTVLVDLHASRWEAAHANLSALVNVAQVNRNLFQLVAQMVRIGAAQIALDATWQALQAPGWNEASLRSLQELWAQMDLAAVPERALAGELAAGVDTFQRAHSAGGKEFRRNILYNSFEKSSFQTMAFDHVVLPAYKAFTLDEDEVFFLHSMTNFLYDVRQIQQHAAWPEVNALLKQHTAEWDHSVMSVAFHRYVLSERLMANYSKAIELMVQTETRRQLTLTAIALQRYHLASGKHPTGLSALVPEFLPALPLDPMSGKSLGYRATPNGEYVLYSTGEDGVDNGGEAGLGLWTGRDAVFPSLAIARTPPPTP